MVTLYRKAVRRVNPIAPAGAVCENAAMRRFVIALTVMLIGAFAATTAAVPQTTVVEEIAVSNPAGFLATNARGYKLRFYSNGTASFDGIIKGTAPEARLGHYVATVKFEDVRALADEASLCTRPEIPKLRLAERLFTPAPVELLSARCSSIYRAFNYESGTDIAPLLKSFVKIGSTLDWKYEGPARRDDLVLFAR
jgi:hypothetical protein